MITILRYWKARYNVWRSRRELARVTEVERRLNEVLARQAARRG